MRCLCLALVLVAAAGCDSAPVEPPSPAPVMPLAVGAGWVLTPVSTVRFEPDGTVRDTAALTAADVVLTIDRDTVVAGERWYRITSTRSLSHCAFADSTWLANREDGLYRWTDAASEAELVYAVAPSPDPFIDTPEVEATLTDPEAPYALPSVAVTARRYDRTWKRLEFNDRIRGPIDPNAHSRDYLSPDLGLVALEVSFVRTGNTMGQFVPNSTTLYELSEYRAP